MGETSKEPGSFFMFECDLVGYAAKLGRNILSASVTSHHGVSLSKCNHDMGVQGKEIESDARDRTITFIQYAPHTHARIYI